MQINIQARGDFMCARIYQLPTMGKREGMGNPPCAQKGKGGGVEIVEKRLTMRRHA